MGATRKTPDIDLCAIGERLRVIRKAHRLTQEQMAEKLGITKTHYGLAERGNTGLSLRKYLLIHRDFDITLDYLLAGEKQNQDDISEIFEDCPKDKLMDLIQILRHACNLYKC